MITSDRRPPSAHDLILAIREMDLLDSGHLDELNRHEKAVPADPAAPLDARARLADRLPGRAPAERPGGQVGPGRLPAAGAVGRGRHGARLQGPAPAAGPDGGAEGDPAGAAAGQRRGAAAVP